MERLTQSTRRVLVLAHGEADRLQHKHVGTDHLLLALVQEKGGVAGRLLRDLGLDPTKVEQLTARG